MGGMKTFAIIFLCLATSVQADSDRLWQTFATCAGRLSAEMEHRWLLVEPVDEITAQRAALIDILDAVQPTGQGSEVLSWRVAAKMAHAALLTRATFGHDADDIAWTRTRIDAQLAECTGLLLG